MSFKSVLENPNVQKLIGEFHLTADHSLNACKYHHKDGVIIIEQIEILDLKGKHDRFADLEKVLPHLKNYPITFKKKT